MEKESSEIEEKKTNTNTNSDEEGGNPSDDDSTTTTTTTSATTTTSRVRSVKTKVPEVEINLYRLGKGPIEIFKSSLGGWDQDQLEVADILEKYGFKSIYAFNPSSGRGVPIRFNARTGRSLLPYTDGSVIFIDGEPKDSLLLPITKIIFGIAFIAILITFVLRESPSWLKKFNLSADTFNFPPWILALVVIVFTRMRKRTRDLLRRFGW